MNIDWNAILIASRYQNVNYKDLHVLPEASLHVKSNVYLVSSLNEK